MSKTIFQTTDHVPAHQRFEYWQDSILPSVDMELVKDRNEFACDRTVTRTAGVMAITTTSSPFAIERHRRHVARDQFDDVSLSVFDFGSVVGDQGGRDMAMLAGNCLITDIGCPFATQTPEAYREARLYVPRDLFIARVGRIELLSALRIGKGTLLADMFLGYFRAYVAAIPKMTEADAETGLDGVLHLLAGLVRRELGAITESGADLSSEAIVALTERYIESRLADPSLDVKAILHAFGISRTRLYAAFSLRGGIRSAISNARLDRVRLLLTMRQAGNRTAPDIAQGCGFIDYPSFSRAFRRRFGCTPSDIRGSDVERQDDHPRQSAP